MKRKIAVVVCAVVSLLLLCSCKDKSTADSDNKNRNPVHTTPVSTDNTPAPTPALPPEEEEFTNGGLTETTYTLGKTGIKVTFPENWSGKYIVEELESNFDYPVYAFTYPLFMKGSEDEEKQVYPQFLFTVVICDTDEDVERIKTESSQLLGEYKGHPIVLKTVNSAPEKRGSYLVEYGALLDDILSGNLKWDIPQ